MRYEIQHPVLNDADMLYWRRIGARSWPTVLMINPEGDVFWGRNGEVSFETLDAVLSSQLPKFREAGTLDTTPMDFQLAERKLEPTPLRFPGKLLFDPESERLFVSDSNHNRIVVCRPDGELLEVIGSGSIGNADGGFADAEFDHPQGMALQGQLLYVADTENHMIRKVDLESRQVTTIAGMGDQARGAYINPAGEAGFASGLGCRG